MGEQRDGREERACYSAELKNALKLNGTPVAIGIVSEPPQWFKKLRRKTTLCVLIQNARKGRSFYCSKENIICRGKFHVGVGNAPIWDAEDFLVRREKIVASRTAARRMLDLAKVQASESGNFIIFSPLEESNFQPDVVVFVGTPLQISRILFLDAFETGEIGALHREPLCSGVIAMPMVTGQIGVSFLDISCRSLGRYRPEEMAIGVPYHRIPAIVGNIERSVAGTAKSSFLLRILPRVINSDKSGT